MSRPEELRDEVYVTGAFRGEGTRGDVSGPMESRRLGDREPMSRDFFREPHGREPHGRAIGSPLPAGNPLGGAGGATGPEGQTHKAANPPGRALTSVMAQGEDPTSMQRAMNMLKQAAPFVARLLPLLDGSFGTALGNLFAPRHSPPPAQVTVDLTPVHSQLSELQLQHSELRSTVQEQTAGLKHVEDRLDLVREATDRNTLEQQELIEDLKAMGNKVNLFALLLSALLLGSILLNLLLYMHIKRVLQ